MTIRGPAYAGTPELWYVQAGGRVWGPYPPARIEAFVAEGRVAAGTLIGPGPQGPFHPAAGQPALGPLFGVVVEAAEAAEPAPTPGLRPLLVWAELTRSAADRLEQGLVPHGPFVRIRPGLWLVQARLGPAALRNALSRRLGASDALMVLEAPLEQAAWFNLDDQTDRALRKVWGE